MQPGETWLRLRANLVHVYTASGVVFAFLATAEVTRPAPDPRWVFAWLAVAVLVDATDGPLARAWEVKRWATGIDGRTIDDIVDYLTFTFIPLLLIWRMGWVPEPAAVWVAPALVASLLGFANTGAKDEEGGFFLGFPSYWNIIAFYAGLVAARWGTWPNAAMLVGLTVLSVLPVRFIYPNLAPRPWKIPVLGGAAVWLGTMVAMLPDYPRTSTWLFAVSLVYPAFYVGLSWHLARRRDRG
jgi:phosphatidylcholine synthase